VPEEPAPGEPAPGEPADPVAQLALALDVTGTLIGGVRESQWTDPTPCSEWNVRDLVNHVIIGNRWFASALAGQPAPTPPVSAPADVDLAGAYRDSAAALSIAFARPGVMDEVITVPFGPVPGRVALHLRSTETLVHGWDLARATGQSAEFPEDLAAEELVFSRGMLARIPPDRLPMAPPQPVPDDASAIDRLAACLGRDVSR
jgi:uncharacterized protein (TIGR03086 family)